MIPGSFDYQRPSSVDEAVGLLADNPGNALILAGGHSLIPMMKLRMAMPDVLIDIQDIEAVSNIQISGSDVEIGAAVTQAELIASDELAAICPILRDTSLQIADPQIRNVGTLGGNVANGDPGNDMPAIMQLLDATFVLTGPDGQRTVQAREFYEAAYFTARDESEMLTAIRFTAPPSGHGASYMKQKRKVGDYATAAAGVILTMSNGSCNFASIGLTNVADTPLWAEEASNALIGTSLDDGAVAAAVEAAKAITDPASDSRGPKEYRTHVAGIMVQRAIRQAQANAA